MTAIAPSTDIYLLKLPIELDDENQLTFASASAQATYFQSLTKTSAEDTTYQRRDETIRYPAGIDTILQYNYVMYKNVNYSNTKWFYARITDMAYINDNMTAISIEEDTFQTWQFDLVYQQCYVEREHVNDDTIGLHTVPENLDTGPIACQVRSTIDPAATILDSTNTSHSYLSGKMIPVFLVSSFVDAVKPTNWYPMNGRTFAGCAMFGIVGTNSMDDAVAAAGVIRAYQKNNTDDEIVSIFMAPIALFNKGYYETKTWTIDGTTFTGAIWTTSELSAVGLTEMTTAEATVARPTNLYGDYVPKNNKLRTWPYEYFAVSNNVGEMLEYHYEDFTQTPGFRIYGVLSQGCATKLVPKHYKLNGVTGQHETEYSINGRKYPICAWSSDSYTNWLTQNGINMGFSAATSLVGGLVQTVMGEPLGLLSSGLSILNSLGSAVQASKLPDRAKGDCSMGDWAQASNETFVVYKYSIRPEYAAIIDGFFSAYGYKINTFKIPNITGRTNWNYVKTIGSAIHAYIPQNAVDKINKMFDNGITLWHNASTFRDYSQSNTIVTPTP